MNSKKYKVLILIVVLQIVLLSCTNKNEKEGIVNSTNESNESNEIEQKISNAWNNEMTTYDVNIPYQLPEFTPKVSKYEVNENLSNLFNANQYTGFTKNQIKSIYEDGFVVLKPNNDVLKLHHVYEYPMYKESPVFITVDSALHLYHIFYDNSLKYVELSSLYDKLLNLSQDMFKISLEYYNNPENQKVKEELKFVLSYFMTGCRLMEIDLTNFEIPAEISTIVEDELKLINEANSFKTSPILGKDFDYSQYIVRGHYANDERLSKYFKTMMWYGQCGFPVFEDKTKEPVLDIDNVIKGMIITALTLKNEQSYIEYENIYSTTALYTGLSDDLGIFEYRDLISNVFGKDPDINIFKDSTYYDKLLKEALLLPEPKIQPKYLTVSTPVGKQFRFMGQRYSFDAETLQNLVSPFERPIPSGLDVISTFGNLRAEELLDLYYKPKESWNEYEEQLKIMREKGDSITEEVWKSDLYNGWLWSIKSSTLSFENVEGMPSFMRNQKWTDKNIHTALGSYAEIKHDSILYKKQSGAEMGGGPETIIPYNYVEPNVEVYAKLKWLAENTKENLKVRDMLDEGTKQILDSIIEMQETLMNVSVKELTNTNITEEENNKLYSYGGRIDNIAQSLNYMLRDKGINDRDDYTSALIADIATVAPSQCLEIGNGLPCEIYVVCYTNGKTYLARGALFNYYEFLSDKRMTDNEWYNLLGVKKVAIVYDEQSNNYIEKDIFDESGNKIISDDIQYFEEVRIVKPSSLLPQKPEWTKSFISNEENNVTITEKMELDWIK